MELDDCMHSVWTKWLKRYHFFSFDYDSPARQRNEISRLCSGWERTDGCGGSETRSGPLLNPNRSTRSFLCSRCSRSIVQSVLRFTGDDGVLYFSSSTWRHRCLYGYSSSLRIKGHRFCFVPQSFYCISYMHVRIIHGSFWK